MLNAGGSTALASGACRTTQDNISKRGTSVSLSSASQERLQGICKHRYIRRESLVFHGCSHHAHIHIAWTELVFFWLRFAIIGRFCEYLFVWQLQQPASFWYLHCVVWKDGQTNRTNVIVQCWKSLSFIHTSQKWICNLSQFCWSSAHHEKERNTRATKKDCEHISTWPKERAFRTGFIILVDIETHSVSGFARPGPLGELRVPPQCDVTHGRGPETGQAQIWLTSNLNYRGGFVLTWPTVSGYVQTWSTVRGYVQT